MSVKIIDDDFLRNANRLNDTMNIGEIARYLGVSCDNLSFKLRTRGYKIKKHYRPAHNAKDFPKNKAIERYISGEPIYKISKDFGVPRSTIRNHLIRNGIKIRNLKEIRSIVYSRMNKKDRIKMTKHANNAVRGKLQKRESRQKIARFRENTPYSHLIGLGENELIDNLIARGFTVKPQFAFDIYNIDLLVNGKVAVEISSTLTKHLKTTGFKKTKKLLDSGYSVLWVGYCKKISFIGTLKKIIACINKLCRLPAGICQYRVIRCYVDNPIIGQNNLGQFTAIDTPKKFCIVDKTSDFILPS